MGLLRHKSEREVWDETAVAVGGRVVSENTIWGSGGRIEAPLDGGPWQVVLDVYTVPVMIGKVFVAIPFARAVAPFQTHDSFRFSVNRANPFTGIAKLFRMQDREIGDDSFDRAFVVKGSDTDKALLLLGGEAGLPLREKLRQMKDIHLGVSDDGREAYVNDPLPDETDVVYAVNGLAGTEELIAAYNVVAETLRGLHRIGSASAKPSPEN